MSKTTVKMSDSSLEIDKAKRIYRAALDTIRRLDEILKQKKAYKDVFLPESVNLRSRLQEYCEKLMFWEPVEYGRKAEELLWRKVYYEVIHLMKHNRKQMRPSSSVESAFRTHLSSATGYYCHLLFKLQSEFQLHVETMVDFYFVSEPKSYSKRANSSSNSSPSLEAKAWAMRACHRCLVYLGDIARYQQDYDGIRSKALAQRYYHQALAICPEIGMPHNQLGTLAGNRYYNLDATYYYLRCLVSSTAFEGASGNLSRLLEKNRRRYKELSKNSPRDLPPDQQRSKDIRRFIVRLLHLLDILFANKHILDLSSLQEHCQLTLQDFNLCMFYQPSTDGAADPEASTSSSSRIGGAGGDDRLQHMEEEVVLKVVVICMMAIHRLQQASNKQVTAAIAFSLALFSHLLNHVVIRVQSALYELENPRLSLLADTGDVTTDAEEGSPPARPGSASTHKSSSSPSTPKRADSDRDKSGKKREMLKRMKRRRRRRRGDSDTSSSSASDDDDDDALSDASDGPSPSSRGSRMSLSEEDEEDEEAAFLAGAGASSSEEEEEEEDSEAELMVSQELRPGFSGGLGAGELDTPESLESRVLDAMTSGGGDPAPPAAAAAGSMSLSNSFSSSLLNELRQLSSGGEVAPLPADVSDYLPVDWLENKDSLKETRVPPGFEKSMESQAVQELTEKLANFVIETDTDSNFPTDTETTMTTESEQDAETETETDKDSVIDRKEQEQERVERVLKVVSGEGLLMAVKVYCDWMKCNPHIIATCAKTSQALWSRLSVLLNFLPREQQLASKEVCKSPELATLVSGAAAPDWTSPHPLQEDTHLYRFPPLDDGHRGLRFHSNTQLTHRQQAILRICMLRKFGYFAAKLKSVNFTYDVEKGLFYGPLQMAPPTPPPPAATEAAPTPASGSAPPAPTPSAPAPPQLDARVAQQRMVDHEARRNQLMRDMAQLRLRAEVSQLERKSGSKGADASSVPAFPPYLVPDTSALTDTLPLIRQLTNSARFIVIVPLAVIDQLDILKKESSGARDSIRWLETEFKKGSRYIRAQKSHEKTSVLPLKNLKKKDRATWRFIQMVDCAKYLAATQGGGGNQQHPPSSLVSVVTASHLHSQDVSLRVKEAIIAQEHDGIAIQNVTDFFNRWKEAWKNKS